jgi:hypothetical protein
MSASSSAPISAAGLNDISIRDCACVNTKADRQSRIAIRKHKWDNLGGTSHGCMGSSKTCRGLSLDGESSGEELAERLHRNADEIGYDMLGASVSQ